MFSIGFAENICIEATFPANNPIKDAPEIKINNPMTPLNRDSFWCKYMNSVFNETPKDIYDKLVQAVTSLFQEWEKKFRNNPEIHVNYKKSYFIGDSKILTKQAGIRQIKDYADHYKEDNLKNILRDIQKYLSIVKKEFHTILIDKDGLDYFGKARNQADLSNQEAEIVKIEKIEKRETKKQRRSKKA